MARFHVTALFQPLLLALFLAACLLSAVARGIDTPELTASQQQWLGDQIFRNECNSQPACLTAWNAGEDFPSMGIGHFIWYRKGQQEIYAESFPGLLPFMQERGLEIPGWIIAADLEAPWPDRAAFIADQDSSRMRELRRFLEDHTAEQTAFILSRFDSALDAMLASTPDQGQRDRLAQNFHRVAASSPPNGLYALIDYVNFKGSGTSPAEHYQGQGWGLKQVLLGMDNAGDALAAFVTSARGMLARRVDNAPPERNESRWLKGWNNRLDTYQPLQRKQQTQHIESPLPE